MSDPASNKREKLIDELLSRKEFAELWVLKWAELLQIRSSNAVSYKATLLYYNWLQDRIARNVPVNEWVRELLSASGGTFKNPATNFFQNEQDILKVSENVIRYFLSRAVEIPPAVERVESKPVEALNVGDIQGAETVGKP